MSARADARRNSLVPHCFLSDVMRLAKAINVAFDELSMGLLGDPPVPLGKVCTASRCVRSDRLPGEKAVFVTAVVRVAQVLPAGGGIECSRHGRFHPPTAVEE